MFSIHGPHANISAGESGQAFMIHFSVTLLYLNEKNKVVVIYCHMGLHQYGAHLGVDILEQ